MPRELTGQIKPHGGRMDGGTSGGEGERSSSGTAGEESERISWPTQKPTLLMTLSAVISGCYLSWLPGAHLLRITNLHTLPPPRPSFSRLSFAILSSPFPASLSPFVRPCAIRITESGDLFRSAAFFETDTCIFKIYESIKKFKRVATYRSIYSDFKSSRK